jgi:hypothetical protein
MGHVPPPSKKREKLLLQLRLIDQIKELLEKLVKTLND